MGPGVDVLVLGVTGATGREVARHLAQHAAADGVTWAAAGRDVVRVRAVLASLGASDVPVIAVDADDGHAVLEVVSRARVVANLVGPYASMRADVQAACIAAGVDGIDVCAEVDWLAGQAARLHPAASAGGRRIVTACGFESLPFDLATRALARAMRDRHGEALVACDVGIVVWPDPPVSGLHDIVSGGTVRTGTSSYRRGVAAVATDVRLLDPRPHAPYALDLQPWREPIAGRWVGPLLPTPYINPAIVYRSAGLLSAAGLAFAEGFRYRDGLVADDIVPGIPGRVAATWLSGLQAVNTVLGSGAGAVSRAVADVYDALGPPPGSRPSDAHLDGWRWRLDALATTTTGRRCRAIVVGEGHPGYRASGRLAAEAALALLSPAPSPAACGLVTPAVALGHLPLDRWQRAGCEILVEPPG